MKNELRESRTISNWGDLEQDGIEYLTSESCAYGIRALVDLDPSGVEVVKEFLGIPVAVSLMCPRCREMHHANLKLGENWNTVGATPENHVSSIMLPREMFTPLAVYILLRQGYHIVIARASNLIGYTKEVWDAEFREIYEKSRNKDYRVYTQPSNPARDGRHVHHFTGRAS